MLENLKLMNSELADQTFSPLSATHTPSVDTTFTEDAQVLAHKCENGRVCYCLNFPRQEAQGNRKLLSPWIPSLTGLPG